MAGNKPDYLLYAKPKGEGGQASIGAAWVGESSTGVQNITIKLNPGVRISWDDELVFKLWPNNSYPKE